MQQVPTCKKPNHYEEEKKFVCFESECPDKNQWICSICAFTHQNHQNKIVMFRKLKEQVGSIQFDTHEQFINQCIQKITDIKQNLNEKLDVIQNEILTEIQGWVQQKAELRSAVQRMLDCSQETLESVTTQDLGEIFIHFNTAQQNDIPSLKQPISDRLTRLGQWCAALTFKGEFQQTYLNGLYVQKFQNYWLEQNYKDNKQEGMCRAYIIKNIIDCGKYERGLRVNNWKHIKLMNEQGHYVYEQGDYKDGNKTGEWQIIKSQPSSILGKCNFVNGFPEGNNCDELVVQEKAMQIKIEKSSYINSIKQNTQIVLMETLGNVNNPRNQLKHNMQSQFIINVLQQ